MHIHHFQRCRIPNNFYFTFCDTTAEIENHEVRHMHIRMHKHMEGQTDLKSEIAI